MKKLERFSQNHIIIFSFIIVIMALLIWKIQWDDDSYMGFDIIASRVLTCILAIWLISKILFSNISSFFKTNDFFKGFIFGIPLLLLGIGSSVFSNSDFDYTNIGLPDIRRILIFTLSMFMIGAAEEIVFRGILLNNMIKKWGSNKDGVVKSIIVSAIVFGVAHLNNLLYAPIITVIVQTINAACIGVLLSVIYIRCQNIWSVIFVHMLVNWFAFFLQQCFVGTMSIVTNELSISQALLVVFTGSSIPLFLSVLYMRKYKDKE